MLFYFEDCWNDVCEVRLKK